MTDEPDDTEEPEAEAQEQEAPPPEQPAKGWSEVDEADARALGWKPRDEWKGEVPPGYIDAPREYLDRAERILPFRKLKERMEASERKHAADIASVKADQAKAYEAARKREIAAIREEMAASVRLADEDRYKAAEAKLDKLQEQPSAQTTAQPGPGTEDERLAHQWHMDNRETVSDPYRYAVANAAFMEAADKPMAERLAYASRRVAEMFGGRQAAPDPQAQRAVAAKVDQGGLARAPRKEAFDGLPEAARDVFKQEVAKGRFKDTAAERKAFHDDYMEVAR